MSVERARRFTHPKPWGVSDLGRWGPKVDESVRTGEIWFERASQSAPQPSLLLKLLYTSEPLSIQVHPDDSYAQTIGLPHGRTEAWYVVDAATDAHIGLGLTQRLTRAQLRHAISEGTVADLVLRRRVVSGDSCLVPAGTIHTIGAGLVIAEIQQRADVTFRLFDHDRGRELHLKHGAGAANGDRAPRLFEQCRLSETRRLLAACPYFVFERLDLPPDTSWRLHAGCETWLLALDGGGTAGDLNLSVGDAIFVQDEHLDLHVGPNGLVALLSYAECGPHPFLLQQVDPGARNDFPDMRRAGEIGGFAGAMTAWSRLRQEICP